jgi:SAM-dependent methyltransferase
MDGYEPVMSFTEEVAASYDELCEDGAQAAALLARLAGNGPALELAIGTGRLALPLARHGVNVEGIDFSAAMVARLRSKPGGEQIKVTMGNYADVEVEGNYQLIYLACNSLSNLVTQDEQVRCFENVAKHLADGGVFVVEALVPTHLMDLRQDQYVIAETIATDEVRLDVVRHDGATQLLYESHVSLRSQGIALNPIITRYSWPAELDLMARLAGLALRDRWGGWNNEPFTTSSPVHVSVYAHRTH